MIGPLVALAVAVSPTAAAAQATQSCGDVQARDHVAAAADCTVALADSPSPTRAQTVKLWLYRAVHRLQAKDLSQADNDISQALSLEPASALAS